jgi:hypothetical protein
MTSKTWRSVGRIRAARQRPGVRCPRTAYKRVAERGKLAIPTECEAIPQSVSILAPSPSSARLPAFVNGGRTQHHHRLRGCQEQLLPGTAREELHLDVGCDLGSMVAKNCFDSRPFKFEGHINKMKVELK